MTEQNTALAVVETQQPSAIVEADPGLVVAAFQNYIEVQRALDNAMPDCIMQIKGKPFRKKQYWRAIATAFNLRLECVGETRESIEGKPISPKMDADDWGYRVTYRATAGNGRSCDGDGSCFASEKLDRDGYATAMQTEHNVRAHAHTRAKNRAIADLVGFGEVSAEEVQREYVQQPSAKPKAATKAAPALRDDNRKRLGLAFEDAGARLIEYAIAEDISTDHTDADAMTKAVKRAAIDALGIKPADVSDKWVDALEAKASEATLDHDTGEVAFMVTDADAAFN